jgi:hypothetical protein
LALGLVGASLMGASLGGISAASAQPYYYGAPRYYAPVPRYYNDGLAPQQVMRIVRRAGFIPLSAPARRGPNYVVVAADPAGGQVRVAVNAYEGDVISVRPVAALQPYGAPGAGPYDPPPRVGALPPGAAMPHELKDPPNGAQPPNAPYGRPSAGIDGGAPMTPPRPVPNSRLSNAPMNSANATPTNTPPARTPIPRPRPNVAANTAASPPEAGPAAATPPAAVVPAEKSAETAPQAEATPPAKPATTMVPVAPLD